MVVGVLPRFEVAGSNPVVRTIENPRSRMVFRVGSVVFDSVHPACSSHPRLDSRHIGFVKGSVCGVPAANGFDHDG
jgi:hypothetical protein